MVYRLLLLAAAVLFSTGGMAIKACTLSSWQIASLRAAIAVPTLLLLLPETRRGTGLTWALTVMGLRWATSATGSNGTVMVAGNLIAFASCLPTALPLPSIGIGDWLILVYLGVFQIGLAYVLVSRGIRHVRPWKHRCSSSSSRC